MGRIIALDFGPSISIITTQEQLLERWDNEFKELQYKCLMTASRQFSIRIFENKCKI